MAAIHNLVSIILTKCRYIFFFLSSIYWWCNTVGYNYIFQMYNFSFGVKRSMISICSCLKQLFFYSSFNVIITAAKVILWNEKFERKIICNFETFSEQNRTVDKKAFIFPFKIRVLFLSKVKRCANILVVFIFFGSYKKWKDRFKWNFSAMQSTSIILETVFLLLFQVKMCQLSGIHI